MTATTPPPMSSPDFRLLRLSLGLSKTDVAELAGVQHRTAQRWETGLTPPPDVVDRLQARQDAALERIDRLLSSPCGHRLPGPLPTYRPTEEHQCRQDTGMSIPEYDTLLTHLAMTAKLQRISVTTEQSTPPATANTAPRQLKADYDRLGCVLALYGLAIYTAGARIVEDGQGLSVTADWGTVATRIQDHARAVHNAEWARPSPETGRELLGPTSTHHFTADHEWDRWLAHRSRLLAHADPISRTWLQALFHTPADRTSARAGWSALDMIPGNRGNNPVRRLHRLATALADRPHSDIVSGLIGTVTREASRWQVTGGTWDRPGQDTSAIDDIWGWLSLLGMTFLPATATGTSSVIGGTFDGWILLPLRSGPVSRIAMEDTAEVIHAVNGITTALRGGSTARVLIDPYLRGLPPVQVWRISVRSSGHSVTRRAETSDLQSLRSALLTNPPATKQAGTPPERTRQAPHATRRRAKVDRSAAPAKIRAWGLANGYTINARGPLPTKLREDFHRAHSGNGDV